MHESSKAETEKIRSRASELHLKVSRLEEFILSEEFDFVRGENLAFDLNQWPEDISSQFEFSTRNLQSGGFLDSEKLRKLSETVELSEGVTSPLQSDLGEKWIEVADNIAVRLRFILELPGALEQLREKFVTGALSGSEFDSSFADGLSIRGNVGMLQAELALDIRTTSDKPEDYPYKGVSNFWEIFDELVALYRDSVQQEKDRIFWELVEKNKLWHSVNWPEGTQQRLLARTSSMRNQLAETEAELAQIPIDLRYPDSWYQIDTYVCTRGSTGESERIITDVRDKNLEELSELCRVFPSFNAYYFEKAAALTRSNQAPIISEIENRP